MEAQRIANCDQVQSCALSKQSDGYCFFWDMKGILLVEFQERGVTVSDTLNEK